MLAGNGFFAQSDWAEDRDSKVRRMARRRREVRMGWELMLLVDL